MERKNFISGVWQEYFLLSLNSIANDFELFVITLILRLHSFDVTSIIASEAVLSYEAVD